LKRLIATLLLARRVRPSARFAIRQLRGAPGPYRYSLRGTPYSVFIRHDSDDPFVLDECFGRLRQYEFPAEVAATLDGPRPPRVVDLGANIGLFGLLAIDRFPGARVTGFEPDPANAEIHERCIEANGLGDRWQLIPAFAAAADREVRFLGGRSSRSRAAADAETARESETGEGAQAVAVEAIDVFPHLEEADLIKIDIEGGEWELLGDPRFARLGARAIVLEYHENGCPGPDPRAAALSAIGDAGYEAVSVNEGPEAADPFEGRGTVWGCRAVEPGARGYSAPAPNR
jgi:FkbM family methyltransferase